MGNSGDCNTIQKICKVSNLCLAEKFHKSYNLLSTGPEFVSTYELKLLLIVYAKINVIVCLQLLMFNVI